MSAATRIKVHDHSGGGERLSPVEWQDLRRLLAIFDEWLLYAEPATIRELDRLLQSFGMGSGSSGLIIRLGELRLRIATPSDRAATD